MDTNQKHTEIRLDLTGFTAGCLELHHIYKMYARQAVFHIPPVQLCAGLAQLLHQVVVLLLQALEGPVHLVLPPTLLLLHESQLPQHLLHLLLHMRSLYHRLLPLVLQQHGEGVHE